MRKLILALMLLSPAIVSAQIPTGCYSTQPLSCYISATPPLDLGSYSANFVAYGDVVADLLEIIASGISELNQCNDDLNGWSSLFDECLATGFTIADQRDNLAALNSACEANSLAIESNRQEWIAYGKYQARLVRKIRKKCGAPCRKIR